MNRYGLRCATLALALLLAGCDGSEEGMVRLPSDAAEPANEPPVAINPDVPIEYPAALLHQGIEGKVILRLYVDARGTVITDSTRIEESSGYPLLDSAATRAAGQLRFAPARRNGAPVATAFLQPVHFRNPQGAGTRP